MMNIVGQSITIMGQQLGAQELARADVVIRPPSVAIGATDFEQKNQAILEGEKAALAAMPSIRARLAAMQSARRTAAMAQQAGQPPVSGRHALQHLAVAVAAASVPGTSPPRNTAMLKRSALLLVHRLRPGHRPPSPARPRSIRASSSC